MTKAAILTPVIVGLLVALLAILVGLGPVSASAVLIGWVTAVIWGYVAMVFVVLPIYALGVRGIRFIFLGSILIAAGVLELLLFFPETQLYLIRIDDLPAYINLVSKELLVGVLAGILLTLVFSWFAAHNKRRLADAAHRSFGRYMPTRNR